MPSEDKEVHEDLNPLKYILGDPNFFFLGDFQGFFGFKEEGGGETIWGTYEKKVAKERGFNFKKLNYILIFIS